MAFDLSPNLGNIGNITKPAGIFAQRMFDFLEGLRKPTQIVELAKAESKAAIIKRKAEIELTELDRRAMKRWLAEESRNQDNMEQISKQALPLITETAHPDQVSDDWIHDFYEKCRRFSDKDMQVLWARILAGEVNKPGAFSPQTVNLTALLNKEDMHLFEILCGRIVMLDGRPFPIICGDYAKQHRTNLTRENIIHLDTFGLIKYSMLGEYRHRPAEPAAVPPVNVKYFGNSAQIHIGKNRSFNLGHVILSRAGRELIPLCNLTEVSGYFEYLLTKWKREGHQIMT